MLSKNVTGSSRNSENSFINFIRKLLPKVFVLEMSTHYKNTAP